MADAAPQINSGTSLQSVIGSGAVDTGTYRKGLSTIIKGIEDDRTSRKEIPDATPPQLEPEPKMPQPDAWQSFGSFGMVLATLGSLMTKRPFETALNSGAEVLKARNKADYAAYQDAFNKWKVNTDNAWKMADWNRNQRKDIYERLKDDQSALTTEMEVWSKATQDPTLDHAIKAQDLQNAHISYDKAVTDLGKAKDNIRLEHEKTTAIVDEWKEKNGVTYDKAVPKSVFTDAQIRAKAEVKSAEKGGVGGVGVPTWTPAAIEKAADAVAGGVRLNVAVPGFGKNNPNRDAVMNLIAEKYPDLDLAQVELGYGGQAQEARTVGAAAGRIKLAANSLDQAIPLARDAASKIDLTQFPDLNTFENYARVHSGDPSIVALNAAIQTVISDYSSLIARNGVQTDSTRAASRDLVNSSMSKGQLDSFFKQVDKEKVAQLKAIDITRGQKIGETSGKKKPSDKHIKMLHDDPSPEAKSEFDEVYGSGAAAKALGE